MTHFMYHILFNWCIIHIREICTNLLIYNSNCMNKQKNTLNSWIERELRISRMKGIGSIISASKKRTIRHKGANETNRRKKEIVYLYILLHPFYWCWVQSNGKKWPLVETLIESKGHHQLHYTNNVA